MSRASPRISIVLGAYNAAGPLGVLLDSLCRSQFQDFEVCLCDDGSTDETRRVAESYAGRLDVRLAFHARNQGVTRARNTALAMARGPLLLFLDADVRLHPDTMDRLLQRLERSGADVVDGIYSAQALDPGPFSDYYALFVHHSFLQGGAVPRYNVFNAWCALCRRAVMDTVGGHQELAKGVEVENESLGRRIVARGFVIFLEPEIAVDHHRGGWRKLIFIFTSRVYWWVKVYFASDRRFEAALTTRFYAFGTVALPAAVLVLILGGGRPASGAVAGAGSAVFLWAYSPFYRFVWRRRGALFMLWSALLSASFSFLVAASAAYSVTEEVLRLLLRGRTALRPETLAP